MNSKRGDFVGLDPAVADLLGAGERRQDFRQQPQAEKRRQVKEREKMRARSRVMLDLSEEQIEQLRELAETHRVPMSQVAGLMIRVGLEALEEGSVSLDNYKRPSKSPKYDWNLDF